MTNNKKPPIGIVPEKFWKKQRVIDLSCAIVRYMEAGLEEEPSVKLWREEYWKWIDELGIEAWINDVIDERIEE